MFDAAWGSVGEASQCHYDAIAVSDYDKVELKADSDALDRATDKEAHIRAVVDALRPYNHTTDGNGLLLRQRFAMFPEPVSGEDIMGARIVKMSGFRVSFRYALFVTFAAGILPPVAAASAPTTQTFKPSGLGLSLALPADWGTTYPDAGTRFQVMGPGRVAQLHLITARTTVTLSQAAANLVGYERKQLAKLKGSAASQTMTVASSPAVLVTVRWRGSDVSGGGYANLYSAAGETYEFDYLFERSGLLYIFDYSTTANWLAKEKPIFDASLRSIHFARVA